MSKGKNNKNRLTDSYFNARTTQKDEDKKPSLKNTNSKVVSQQSKTKLLLYCTALYPPYHQRPSFASLPSIL